MSGRRTRSSRTVIPLARGSPSHSAPGGHSPTHSVLDGNSPAHSAPNLGSPTHSALDPGSPIDSALDEDSPTYSERDIGSPDHLDIDLERPTHLQIDVGTSTHVEIDLGSSTNSDVDLRSPLSTLEEGNSNLSELDLGSPLPTFHGDSPTDSTIDLASATHSDRGGVGHAHSRGTSTHSVIDLAISSLFDDDDDNPTHSTRNEARPTLSSLEQGSPSILERDPTNGDVEVLENTLRQLHESSPEYSETENYDPFRERQRPRSIVSVDDAQARLSLIARRIGFLVQNQIRSLRGDSITISSTSGEESNQSLPENSAPTEAERETGNDNSEPPAKVRKISSPDRNEDLDGETCPICLDTWSNSGKHRLVSLKCGHLFGAECVERWLKAQPSRDRSCPTCKTKAGLKDLRFIYARRLIAADTSELTRLQQHAENLQAEKNRTELDLQSAKMSQRHLARQVEELKKTLSMSLSKAQAPRKPCWRFALEKNLEMCKDGGCRVLTYNCRTYELYVSQKSVNYLFPGYGIRKVSCLDYTLGHFVHLHPKPIRDITYSQPTDLLLSVGLDSTARIVERGIPNMTVNAGFPLWSCAWDRHNSNEFYVGGVGGMIHLYDFRNPATSLRTLCGTGDMSPVVSVYSTDHGLLSCQLNSCWLWQKHVDVGEWVPKVFPVNGAFTSMTYNYETEQALLSMRPKGAERSKLTVCSLVPFVGGGADINVDYVLNGSARTSVMSRATFCKAPGSTWVAAHSESDATLYLHGLDGARSMSLPAAEPALDVCSVQMNGYNLLAALSESRLRIYKAVPTG